MIFYKSEKSLSGRWTIIYLEEEWLRIVQVHGQNTTVRATHFIFEFPYLFFLFKFLFCRKKNTIWISHFYFGGGILTMLSLNLLHIILFFRFHFKSSISLFLFIFHWCLGHTQKWHFCFPAQVLIQLRNRHKG